MFPLGLSADSWPSGRFCLLLFPSWRSNKKQYTSETDWVDPKPHGVKVCIENLSAETTMDCWDLFSMRLQEVVPDHKEGLSLSPLGLCWNSTAWSEGQNIYQELRRAGVSVGNPHGSSFRSVFRFVVWFFWNNLMKAAGGLNSERKLCLICLSFLLKSCSHPATLPPAVTAVFIIFLLCESIKNCYYLITFTITPVAVRKQGLIRIKNREKCFCLIEFWSGSASSVFLTPPERFDFFHSYFQSTLSSSAFLT